MATTAQQIYDTAMGLIDEVLEDGTVSATDTAVYAAKAPRILSMLQNELMRVGDLFKTHEISNKPIENILGYTSNFNIVAFEGTELTYECSQAAKAYYFEVDKSATVYVEDYTGAWNTLATVACAPTASGFTAYKGVVTPTSGATKSRLRFAGSYYYRSVNRALFKVPFASSADMPDYRPWFKKSMPSDFKSVDQIVEEFPERQYAKSSTYKWEGRNSLYINYYYDGNIRITYRPIPVAVTALSQTLEVDDITATTVLPNGLAAHLLLSEDPSNANFFLQRFEGLKAEATIKQPTTENGILSLYGGFDG